MIGETQHIQTVAFEFLRSFFVIDLGFGSEMTVTVNFDNEFELCAVEVHDEVVNGALAEDTILEGAEVAVPEFVFGGGGVLAKFFGAVDEVAIVGEVDGHGECRAEWV